MAGEAHAGAVVGRRVMSGPCESQHHHGRYPARGAEPPDRCLSHSVQVYFTRAAREDLITTWAQIAEDNPQAADRVLDRL